MAETATDGMDPLMSLIVNQAIMVHDRNLAIGAVAPGKWDVVESQRIYDDGKAIDCRCRLRRTRAGEIEIDYAYARPAP